MTKNPNSPNLRLSFIVHRSSFIVHSSSMNNEQRKINKPAVFVFAARSLGWLVPHPVEKIRILNI
jgi:hypothetical protein